jgi:hypothetical protein
MNASERAEIIAKELNKQNEWFRISIRTDLTTEDMIFFKNNLIWDIVLSHHKNLPNDLLDQMIIEGKIELDTHNKRMISEHHAKDKEFIKKYSDSLDIKDICKNNKFKTSEIVEMFGKIQIGEGATIGYGSDCNPYTIIEISKSGLKAKIQSDNYEKAEGYDYYSNQKFEYSRNENGGIVEISLKKDGRWKTRGNSPVGIGFRKRYSDPSY